MLTKTTENCLVVTPANESRGYVRWQDRTFDCALGKSGVAVEKREGDGATPPGRFLIRHILYRPDRIEKPLSGLPIYALDRDNGWCDAPDHPDYNRFVHLPHAAHCEKLWREDHIYDLIIILAYNDDPVQPGKGSAIFMHVARPGLEPTEGCIALEVDDLLEITLGLDKDSLIEIQPS